MSERCKNETSTQFAHATSYSTKLSLCFPLKPVLGRQFFDFCYITSTPGSLKIFKFMEESPWALGTSFFSFYFFQISDVVPLASIQKRDLALISDKFLFRTCLNSKRKTNKEINYCYQTKIRIQNVVKFYLIFFSLKFFCWKQPEYCERILPFLSIFTSGSR